MVLGIIALEQAVPKESLNESDCNGWPDGLCIIHVSVVFPEPELCYMLFCPTPNATSENGSCAAVFGMLRCRNCTATSAFLQSGSHLDRAAANEKLHCNIEKAALQESGPFLPLSCGFQAPTFRHPRLGPAEFLPLFLPQRGFPFEFRKAFQPEFGAYRGLARVLRSPSNPQNCRKKEKIQEKGTSIFCAKPWYAPNPGSKVFSLGIAAKNANSHKKYCVQLSQFLSFCMLTLYFRTPASATKHTSETSWKMSNFRISFFEKKLPATASGKATAFCSSAPQPPRNVNGQPKSGPF